MKNIDFDFERVGSYDDFYKLAGNALNLPEHFGNNLDALWDVITGDVALPLRIRFTNMSLHQLEIFDKLISLLEDAAEELDGDLVFEFYIKRD